MKKITQLKQAVLLKMLLPLLALVALGACEDTNCIKGEGQVEQRELTLQPFSEVAVNGDFNVYLTQGASQKVEVKGEPNILNELEAQVANGKWNITYRSCIRRSKQVDVYITLPQVTSVYLNGSGGIYSRNTLAADDIPVTLNGSGRIELHLNAAKVMTHLSGSNLVGKSLYYFVALQKASMPLPCAAA